MGAVHGWKERDDGIRQRGRRQGWERMGCAPGSLAVTKVPERPCYTIGVSNGGGLQCCVTHLLGSDNDVA